MTIENNAMAQGKYKWNLICWPVIFSGNEMNVGTINLNYKKNALFSESALSDGS